MDTTGSHTTRAAANDTPRNDMPGRRSTVALALTSLALNVALFISHDRTVPKSSQIVLAITGFVVLAVVTTFVGIPLLRRAESGKHRDAHRPGEAPVLTAPPQVAPTAGAPFTLKSELKAMLLLLLVIPGAGILGAGALLISVVAFGGSEDTLGVAAIFGGFGGMTLGARALFGTKAGKALVDLIS